MKALLIHRSAVIVALYLIAFYIFQEMGLRLRFHALADNLHSKSFRHDDHRFNDGLVVLAEIGVFQENTVYLKGVYR